MGKRRQRESGKCSNCGADVKTAPVPSVVGGFDVVCEYCGHRDHLADERPRPAEPEPAAAPKPAAEPRRAAEPKRDAPRSRALLVVLAVGLIAMIAVIVGFARKGVTTGGSYWDAGPVVVTIGGGEAVVGRVCEVGANGQLFVAAFDSTTRTQRWKAGPYGTSRDGSRYTHFAVVGAHVVVTDFHAKVHILDLQTGKEQGFVTLTDKVDGDIDSEMEIQRNVCAADATHVWLSQLDNRTVLIDLESGTVADAPLPKSCARGFVTIEGMAGVQLVYALGSTSEWDEPHFAAASIPLEAKSVYVVLGKKTPGTPTPMVAGVDKKDRSVRWQVALPAVDLATVTDGSAKKRSAAVCGDRFIGTYGVGTNGWHMTALDATTGVRQWDVVLEQRSKSDSIGAVICAGAHVYVVRKGFDMFDAATGKALGTISP